MTRLIDADAFENYVFDEWENNEISNSDWMTFREWLRDQETVDAVPVIRCKDCIHSTSQVSDDEDNYYCNVMMRCMHSLEYCSNGERKEE